LQKFTAALPPAARAFQDSLLLRPLKWSYGNLAATTVLVETVTANLLPQVEANGATQPDAAQRP